MCGPPGNYQMYGHNETGGDREEFLKQQDQNSQYYYGGMGDSTTATISAGPTAGAAGYPTTSTSNYSSTSTSAAQTQFNQFGSTASGAFDNVDISRNNQQQQKFSSGTPFETVHEYFSVSNKKFQNFLDSTTPHTGPRWLVFTFLLFVFILRVILYEGFYVVAYALGIYLLNIFLLFLSPKFDPAMTEDESGLDNEASLFADEGDFFPQGASPLLDEFRPFVRRLPEFKFWYNAITALCIGLGCTIFPFLDIPVFWPILLMYFVILFALTMRRQIQHMVKYKYLPFDIGKKAYA